MIALEQLHKVKDMSCERCVRAVEDVLSVLPDVESVKADFDTGKVTLIVRAPVAVDLVRRAVEEAGYQLAE